MNRVNLRRYVLYTDDWFGEKGYLDEHGYVTRKLEEAMFISQKDIEFYEYTKLDEPKCWHIKEVIINIRVI